MTGAFTLLNQSYSKVRYTLLYGAYFEPEFPSPNSAEDFMANVAYISYTAYPIEVVNKCRGK